MAKTIKILETFSGIGAQNKAITNINSQRGKKIFDIVATADWDARANISYSAIHHDLNSKYEEILIKNSLVTEHDINVFLNKFNISLNSKSGSRIKSKNLLFKKYLAASILLSDNQVDITKLNPNILREKDIDLVTYSFPCQGLSVANMGRAKGINDNESTSSLVWQIYRILSNSNKKPKYLIMENVKNLLSKKFAPEYEKWKGVLSDLGYKTFTTIINGIDAGSIQKRERVFALSVLKDVYTPFNNDEEFKKYIDSKNETRKLDLEGRKKYFNKVFNFDLNSKDNINVLINDTPSRVKMINSQKIINESSNFIINTLTTKQDRIPCTGVIKHENNLIGKLNYRFITPKEAFMLMGFTENDFNKIRPLYEKNILTKDSLYRQAGNSIVVESITSVFNVIEDIESLGEENGQK